MSQDPTFLFRELAQVNALSNADGKLVWQSINPSLCYIGVLEDETNKALRLVAQTDTHEIIIDVSMFAEMNIKKASDCFITWKNTNGATVGFNFVDASHADRFTSIGQMVKEGKSVGEVIVAFGGKVKSSSADNSTTDTSSSSSSVDTTPASAAAVPVVEPVATSTSSAQQQQQEQQQLIKPTPQKKHPTSLPKSDSSSSLKKPELDSPVATNAPPLSPNPNSGSNLSSTSSSNSSLPPVDSSVVIKCGFLEERRSPIQKNSTSISSVFRGSKKYFTILRGNKLLFYKPEDNSSMAVTEGTRQHHLLLIDQCVANVDMIDAAKRDYSFSVSPGDGIIYSFTCDSPKETEDWVNIIHLSAGLWYAKTSDRAKAAEIIRAAIVEVQSKIDAEDKRSKGPEFQLSYYMDDSTREATNVRIRMSERILETFSLDLYRLRCYEASVNNASLPSPQYLLDSISKTTRQTVSRISALTPILFHAYNAVENGTHTYVVTAFANAETELAAAVAESLAQSNSANNKSIGRGGSFNNGGSSSFARSNSVGGGLSAVANGPAGSANNASSSAAAASSGSSFSGSGIGSSLSIAKLIRGEIQKSPTESGNTSPALEFNNNNNGSSNNLLGSPNESPSLERKNSFGSSGSGSSIAAAAAAAFAASGGSLSVDSNLDVQQPKRSRSPSFGKTSKKSDQIFIRANLSFIKEKTTLPSTADTKVSDIIEMIAKKKKLDPSDLFLQVNIKGKITEPAWTTVVSALGTTDVEILKKVTRNVELLKDGRDSFGLVIKTADIGMKSKTLILSRLQPGGIAARSEQLFPFDELLEVNGVDARTKSIDHITNIMRDSNKLTLLVRSKVLTLNIQGLAASLASSSKRVALTDEQIKSLIFPPPPTRQLDFEDHMIRSLVIPTAPTPSSSVRVALSASQSVAFPLTSISSETDIDVILAVVTRAVSDLSQLISRVSSAGKKAKMSKVEMRDNVVMELINTEKKYLADLNQFIELYIDPLKASNVLAEPERMTIECNINRMRTFHTKLCSDLDSVLEYERLEVVPTDEAPKKCFGDVFIENIEGFKLYADYCSNHPNAVEVLQWHESDPAFLDFIAKQNPSNEQSLKLESFLIKPVQRILKYPLLMRELLRYSQIEEEGKTAAPAPAPATAAGETKPAETKPDPRPIALQKAMAALVEVANMINERKRRQETLDKVKFLEGEEWDGPSMSELGDIVHCGEILRIDPAESTTKKKEVELFLFTKAVLFCRNKNKGQTASKKNTKPVYKFLGSVSIRSMLIRSLQDTEDDKNIWELVDMGSYKQAKPTRITYVLYSKSVEDKKTWMQLIKQEITSNILAENKDGPAAAGSGSGSGAVSASSLALPASVSQHAHVRTASTESGDSISSGSMVSATAAAWAAMANNSSNNNNNNNHSGSGSPTSDSDGNNNNSNNNNNNSTAIRRSDSFTEAVAMDDRFIGGINATGTGKPPKKEKETSSPFGTLPRRFMKK